MTVQGLDLSDWQSKVDFKQVKADGYKFVILKAGYGSALKYPKQYDENFETFYKDARAVGLDIGAYWYSYADSVTAAKDEAQAFIKALNGKRFEYPVYMDIEEKSQFYRGMAFCDSIITAFCDELIKAGYYAGVYCSTYWYTNFVSKAVRDKYPCWIADYASKCSYKGSYGIWQNGLTYLAGTGNVDHDFCYVDYPSIIKAAGKNGYKQQPAPTPVKKPLDDIAREVIAGLWSAGEERKKKLTAAGYNYDEVQKRVNEILGISAKPTKKSVDEIAKEVIQGKWSAGAERMKLLTQAGYSYIEVQNRVNKMLKNGGK